MSLYLKLLEGEDQGSLVAQRSLFQSGYLPSLERNIRCGNSLLAPDELPDETLFNRELLRRINPFDWQSSDSGFGAVFEERGGFDAIIGNPPYTRIQVLRELRPEETEAYAHKFSSAEEGSFDISVLFLEHCLGLLRKGRGSSGSLAFITSRQFAEADYGARIRKILSNRRCVEEIVDFGPGLVFPGVGAYTLIVVANSSRQPSFKLTRVPPPPSEMGLKEASNEASGLSAVVPSSYLKDDSWDLLLPDEVRVLEALSQHPGLGEICGDAIFQGVITGADKVFRLIDRGEGDADGIRLVKQEGASGNPWPIESAILRPVLAGRTDIKRFECKPASRCLILPYWRSDEQSNFSLIPLRELRRLFPCAFAWLSENEAKLRSRKSGDWNDENWYAYSRRQNLELFEGPKILIPYMLEELCSMFDQKSHSFVNVSTGGYGVSTEAIQSVSAQYLEALLNSRLLSWTLRLRSRAWRGNWFAARKGNLARIPIKAANADEQAQVVRAFNHCCEAKALLDQPAAESERNRVRRLLESKVASFDLLVEEIYEVGLEARKVIGMGSR